MASLMTAAGMDASAYVISFVPADITTADSGDAITVNITVPYSDVGLLGLVFLPAPDNLSSGVTMAKEGP
jgi:hypothetical protein